MQPEEIPLSLAALPAQIGILGDIALSAIRQAMETDKLEESRAFLEEAAKTLRAIIETAANAQPSQVSS